MSKETLRELAYRLIGRDEAIRGAAKTPSWTSVNKILEFVCQQNLLSDPVVANWLNRLAGDADQWFTRRLPGSRCHIA